MILAALSGLIRISGFGRNGWSCHSRHTRISADEALEATGKRDSDIDSDIHAA